MKHKILSSILFATLFFFPGCENMLSTKIEPEPSNLKMISSFRFLRTDNIQTTIRSDINGKIDEETKTITLQVPKGTDVTALVPTYIAAPKSKVAPGNKAAQDFTEPIDYSVIAENGSQIFYTVTVTIAAR